MQSRYHSLCKRLDYNFKNIKLLQQALTHRSVNAHNNERLEFLGDSILNMVVAEILFNRFTQSSEGDLSKIRASLVKGDMLAEIANELQIYDHIHLGNGENKSGGFRRSSTLADALEAIFAAIYLDSNLAECVRVIHHVYGTRFNKIDLTKPLKDPKTELQEYLQSKKYCLPRYTLQKMTGEQHAQIFYVMCEVMDLSEIGSGETRKKAEQMAAEKILKKIAVC